MGPKGKKGQVVGLTFGIITFGKNEGYKKPLKFWDET